MSNFRLDGQIAVVVGGTGALGSAMARGLAGAGASVAVVGRSAERGKAVVESIGSSGGDALFVACDATDRSALASAQEQIDAALGAPTILINAAGGNDPRVTITDELPFEGIDLDAWSQSFDLILSAGVLLPCQVFGPRLIETGAGSIINIASISGHIPLSKVVAYSAAKAAVINLTQFLAREWAPTVRVNSITPGFFPGEQNRRLLFEEDGTPTPRGHQILAQTPMGRFGYPEELAGACVFLASRASAFVTGADLRVDGGFLSTTL